MKTLSVPRLAAGVAGVAGILVLFLALTAGHAEATHYRWGILSWEPTENPNEVKFTGNHGWRRSAFGDPNPGDIVGTAQLATGDGGYVDLYVRVSTISVARDWFIGKFVDANGNDGVRHTYASPNNNGQPWLAEWTSCCRISPHSSGNFHVNNPDHDMHLETLVDLSGTPNSAPKTILPPINACPINGMCSIPVPVADNEGDALSFRVATSVEAQGSAGFVPPGPPHAPNAATIHPTTGVISWDTNGATYLASEHTLYSMMIMVEDGRTKTPLDFFIELVPPGVVPPHWTTDCNVQVTTRAGNLVTFPVGAASSDAARVVGINHLGLPDGATFPLPTPANPVSSTFTWTPADEQVGSHLVVFFAEDDLGYMASLCPVTIVVEPGASAQGMALGVYAGLNAPAAVEYESDGVSRTHRNAGSSSTRAVVIDEGALQLHVESLRESASATGQGTVSTASAGTSAARVELLGGLVVIEGLYQSATAQWDMATGAHTFTRESHIASLTVAGSPVAVANVAPVDITLPDGLGVLRLFESSTVVTDSKLLFRENLVHGYLRGPYGREEVIVGSILIQAGQGVRPMSQDRLLSTDDDAATGRDAGAATADAIALGPGAYDASMPVGDATDVYAIQVKHGEKITATIVPATRALVKGGGATGIGGMPPVQPELPSATPVSFGLTARLVDIHGDERDLATSLLGGLPARVELNADKTGTWHVEVLRAGATGALNYTLVISVTPVPLLPQADALSLADAPDQCNAGDPAIPLIQSGVWPGVVRDGDFADVYRFTANIGEAVALTLKPGEDPNGVDMMLTLYDDACGYMWSSDLSLAGARGVPELITMAPVERSGDYYVEITRLNGVGNHYLTLAVVNPLPTIPGNDAGTGADAPTSRHDAGAAPTGAFQGRIEDGDAGDAYLMSFVAGREAYVTVHLSALSSASVGLYAPDGSIVWPVSSLGNTWIYRWVPTMSGMFGLEIGAQVAGGNYMVGHAQRPA